MPLLRCSIRGENFPGRLLAQDEKIGFYTTRFVKAGDPEQAGLAALELLRRDATLEVPAEHRSEEAMVYDEDIEEIPDDSMKTAGSGFAFFTMGS